MARVSASGLLDYSTFLGGNGEDIANFLDIDAAGNLYVVGSTKSSNFPILNSVQSTNRGASDGFLTKLNPAGNTILFSTYFGGTGIENAYEVVVDGDANAYFAGETRSVDFPTLNPYPGTLRGVSDAFLVKIATCDTTLSKTTDAFSGGGGSGSVLLTTTPECIWTVAPGAAWIALTSAASGQGNGTITYSVAANQTAAPLAASLTAGNQTLGITVAASVPTLTGISPPMATLGATVPVTITGTNFSPGATPQLTGAGVSITAVQFVSAFQINAIFTIDSAAAQGARNLTVLTANGPTNPVTFTVTQTPTLALSHSSLNFGT
ncbi:MAG: SBBP repeat-containing protein, partial [Bryobacteraceae bacterium]